LLYLGIASYRISFLHAYMPLRASSVAIDCGFHPLLFIMALKSTTTGRSALTHTGIIAYPVFFPEAVSLSAILLASFSGFDQTLDHSQMLSGPLNIKHSVYHQVQQ
jgi:hypothetical protein